MEGREEFKHAFEQLLKGHRSHLYYAWRGQSIQRYADDRRTISLKRGHEGITPEDCGRPGLIFIQGYRSIPLSWCGSNVVQGDFPTSGYGERGYLRLTQSDALNIVPGRHSNRISQGCYAVAIRDRREGPVEGLPEEVMRTNTMLGVGE